MPPRHLQLAAVLGLGLLAAGLSGAEPSTPSAPARIKKKDGTVVTGEIRGLIALRDLTQGEKGGWGLLYYLVPGDQITLIDESGVHWREGKDVELLLYVLGQDPGDDTRGLSRDRVQQMKFLFAHQGSNSSESKVTPETNPLRVQVYGEVIYEKEVGKILPEIVVQHGNQTTKLPVSAIVVPVPRVKLSP